MYTTIRHELPHARKAWPVTLVDPCLLSGYDNPMLESTISPPSGTENRVSELSPCLHISMGFSNYMKTKIIP